MMDSTASPEFVTKTDDQPKCTLPSEPIALIGSSCRFAGGVTSPSELWKVISKPRDLSATVPSDRFVLDGFYHPDAEYHGTTDAPHGYFLDQDHRAFDAHFFNITPKEAESMDPQQRHALETAFEALESAGYTMHELAGQRIAVYVGVMTRDYDTLSSRDELNVSQYAATGNARSIISNRISYFFDFRGPSMTIDTACSASLSALHQAVQSLRSGQVPAACVLGVNLMFTPDQFISESKLHMLSPTGHCRMWDAKADGYARGEGVAAFFLKPLSRALADGDNIQAIIRETGVSSDGRTNGITKPSSTAQCELIRRTYQAAGLDPDNPEHQPQFFEAHGTGTPVGDPIEALAIRDAFFQKHDQPGYVPERKLLVGSVKTIIGHTEGAAGLAGIMKAVQAMKHGCVPPNLHLTDINPDVFPSYDKHLLVPTKLTEWPIPLAEQPRRASVNSFGFGGANAHVIVEHYDPRIHNKIFDPPFNVLLHKDSTPQEKIPLPLLFSAASEKSLVSTLEAWRSYLVKNPTISYTELALDLVRNHSTHAFRTALVADNIASAIKGLSKLITDGNRQITIGHRAKQHFIKPKILGVFTGQGAQYLQMSKQLFETNVIYRKTIEKLDEILDSETSVSGDGFLVQELQAEMQISRIGTPKVSQVLCTALQIALVDLLESFRIRFDTVVGHSSGEIAAAYAAGHLTHRDAMLIAYHRGAKSHLAGGPSGEQGAMLACGLSDHQAHELCLRPEYSNKLFVAAHNSATLTTLSGDLMAVRQALEELKTNGVFARQLNVNIAYHSPHMAGPVTAYSKALKNAQIRPCTPPVGCPTWYSSVTEQNPSASDLSCQYWCDNMSQTVLFREAIEKAILNHSPFDCTIEIGPHAALKTPVKETIKNAGHHEIPHLALLDRTTEDHVTLATFVGEMWTRFGPKSLKFDRVIAGDVESLVGAHLTDKPTYAWDHTQIYWRESRLSEQFHARKKVPHELLGVRTNDDTPSRPRWRNILKLDKLPWAEGHKFQGQVLLPASAYCVMALDAAKAIVRNWEISAIELKDLEFLSSITLEADSLGVETLFTLSIHPSAAGIDNADTVEADFDLESVPLVSHGIPPMKKNFRGRVQITLDMNDAGKFPRSSIRRAETLPANVEAFYRMMEDVGLQYTGPFKALTSLKRRFNYAVGTLDMRHSTETTKLAVSPAMLDSCFHTSFATFSAPGDKSLWTTFLPTKIDRLYFNIAGSGFLRGHDELLVETHLTSYKPYTTESAATIKSDVEVSHHHQGNIFFQLEGLTVTSFAQTTPASDHELYLHTVFELDADEEIISPMSAMMGDMDPLGLKGKKSALPPAAVMANSVNTPPESPMDTELDMPALDADGGDSDCDEEAEFSAEPKAPIVPHLERFRKLLPGFQKYIGNVVRQIVYKYPRLNILDMTNSNMGLTGCILQQANGAFLSYDASSCEEDALAKICTSIKGREKVQRVDLDEHFRKDNAMDPYDLVILTDHGFSDSPEGVRKLRDLRQTTRRGGFLIFISLVSPKQIVATNPAPVPKWSSLLTKHGDFSRVAKNGDQDYTGVASVFVRHAGGDEIRQMLELPTMPKVPALRHLLIVGADFKDPGSLARMLRPKLTPYCDKLTIASSLEKVDTEVAASCTAVLLLMDLYEPVCGLSMSADRLETLKALVRPQVVILWVTMNARDDPDRAASLGLTRSLKAETPSLTLQVLDLNHMPQSVNLILDVFTRLVGLQDRIRSGRLADTNIHIEPELHVGLSQQVFIPRVVPYQPAIERLNAHRRVVTRQVNILDTPMQLVQCNTGAYDFEAVDFPEDKHDPVNRAHEFIDVEYSSLQRAPIGADKGLHVFIGRLAGSSGRSFLGLGEVSGSVIRSRPYMVQDVEDMVSTPAERLSLITGVCKMLQAIDLVTRRTEDRDIILVEPDNVLVECFRHLLSYSTTNLNARRGQRRLRVLSSNRALNVKNVDVVRVDHRSTARELGVALSALEDCAVLNFLSPEERISKILASMRGAFKYSYAADFLQLNEGLEIDKLSIEASSVLIKSWTSACQHTICVMYPQDRPSLQVTPTSCTPAQIVQNNLVSSYRSGTIIDWLSNPNLALPIQPIPSETTLRKDRTYLLFGLTRDLGQSLCRLFLAQGARYFVIASRNPDMQPAWVSELNAQGAHIVVARVDVTNLTEVQALATRLFSPTHPKTQQRRAALPPVGGVVNGAMVLEDRVFSQMSIATWARVMGPKARGSRNLDTVFSPSASLSSSTCLSTSPSASPFVSTVDLDFFIMTSSFAAIGGHAGQANYASANMYMNGLAENRRQRGLAATALNIGVIYGLGLLARENRQTTYGGLERDGYPPISERDLHHMFLEAIVAGKTRGGAPAAGAGFGVHGRDLTTGLARYRVGDSEPMHWHLDPRFCHFTLEDNATRANDDNNGLGGAGSKSVLDLITKMDTTEDIATVLLEAFCRRVEAILQHPTGSIVRGEASFAELGVDSLAAVEIRNWLYKAVGQDVPVMKILGSMSIARLCDDIAEKIVQGRTSASE